MYRGLSEISWENENSPRSLRVNSLKFDVLCDDKEPMLASGEFSLALEPFSLARESLRRFENEVFPDIEE
jgi:hypothetical protein